MPSARSSEGSSPRAADELTRGQIIDAALLVLRADGLDAVSMRRIASELDVSPFPLYSKVGNKDDILDAMADRLADQLVLEPLTDEAWDDYALRWCRQLRFLRTEFGDSRLLLRGGRDSFFEATRPLVQLLRDAGYSTIASIDAARLLVWSVLGHCAIELAHATHSGADVGEDELFERHIQFVVAGLSADRPLAETELT